jgi:hypothetical protein
MAILKRPNAWHIVSELSLFVSPIWLAVIIGLFVGWTWKPDWAVGFVNRCGGGSEKRLSGSGREPLPIWRVLSKFDFWTQRGEKTESRYANFVTWGGYMRTYLQCPCSSCNWHVVNCVIRELTYLMEEVLACNSHNLGFNCNTSNIGQIEVLRWKLH